MAACFTLAVQGISAQEKTDSLATDSLATMEDTSVSLNVDSIVKAKTPKATKDWSTWRPNPKRALWLALVIPGGGQIYNRKYWKLPIVYGGFMGCLYAMSWNNTMYKDYSQAYLDLVDNDLVDAYVDAELSVFDISKDLSLKVEPTVINNGSSRNILDNSSVGLQCSLNF